jgi:hypothetical protein
MARTKSSSSSKSRSATKTPGVLVSKVAKMRSNPAPKPRKSLFFCSAKFSRGSGSCIGLVDTEDSVCDTCVANAADVLKLHAAAQEKKRINSVAPATRGYEPGKDDDSSDGYKNDEYYACARCYSVTEARKMTHSDIGDVCHACVKHL